MRKLLISLLVFFLTSIFLRAEIKEVKNSRISVLRGVYFLQDEVFQQVYGTYAWVSSIGYSYRLPFFLKSQCEVGLDYRFLFDKGELTVTKEPVDLMISDVSLTLKYLFDLKKIIFYFGPGIHYIMVKEKYPDTFPVSSFKDSVSGISLQGGCYYDFSSSWGVKLYVQYCFAQTEKESAKADIGGWGIRTGLVYRFDL